MPVNPENYVIETPTNCWIWQGAKNKLGYGYLYADGCNYAHRYHYLKKRGPIPEGFELDHLCRVPACVNPDHLEPVTTAINQQRGAAAVLNEIQVKEIREKFFKGSTQKLLALAYGVGSSSISFIVRGETWANVEGPISQNNRSRMGRPGQRRKLTDSQIAEIQHPSQECCSHSMLARVYGVSGPTIKKIRVAKHKQGAA